MKPPDDERRNINVAQGRQGDRPAADDASCTATMGEATCEKNLAQADLVASRRGRRDPAAATFPQGRRARGRSTRLIADSGVGSPRGRRPDRGEFRMPGDRGVVRPQVRRSSTTARQDHRNLCRGERLGGVDGFRPGQRDGGARQAVSVGRPWAEEGGASGLPDLRRHLCEWDRHHRPVPSGLTGTGGRRAFMVVRYGAGRRRRVARAGRALVPAVPARPGTPPITTGSAGQGPRPGGGRGGLGVFRRGPFRPFRSRPDPAASFPGELLSGIAYRRRGRRPRGAGRPGGDGAEPASAGAYPSDRRRPDPLPAYLLHPAVPDRPDDRRPKVVDQSPRWREAGRSAPGAWT